MTEYKNKVIGIVAFSKYYLEYRNAFCKALKSRNNIADVYNSIEEARSCDIIVVVGMAFFTRVPYLKNKTVIGIYGEQLPFPGDNDRSLKRALKRYKSISRYYDLVVEWYPSNFINHKCPVLRTYVPFGSPEPSNKNKDEEWDILFLGNPFGAKGRRIPILEKLRKEFNMCPIQEAWGEEKKELYNKTKICLNLHQFESQCFESPRIFEILSEGTFLLSETIANSSPFEPEIDYVAFDNVEELINKVRFYLDNPALRKEIARNGKLTADSFKQEQMFELLSVEIESAWNRKINGLVRKSRWLKGRLGNLVIEFFDQLAGLKNKLINKGV